MSLFLEKHSRFFRRYDLTLAPRHKGGAYLPLSGDGNQYSILDALTKRVSAEQAIERQPNGDVVELMEVTYDKKTKALILLFHRGSPDAADPTYRRRAKQAKGKKVTVRLATKQPDEEQSVSAHLVISEKLAGPGVYQSVLEEIPGLSMSVLRPIVGRALAEYEYEFERKNKKLNTHSTFKPVGVKSESLTQALKTGHLNLITLSRPAKPDFVDADGLFKPQTETMKIRVEGEVTSDNWRKVLGNLVKGAKKAGWDDFNVDIAFEDERRRTVKLDREEEAKEILFVRAEQLHFKAALGACTVDIVDEVVTKALGLI